MGLNMNGAGPGSREAQEVLREGEVTLAGPFEMAQGGLGLCGCLPVYLEDGSGEKRYWGLVTVTLDYPDIFADNPVHRLDEQGYACRVWRVNPDDGQEQTVLETERSLVEGAAGLRREMALFNAVWTLDISSPTPWYRRGSLWGSLTGILVDDMLLDLQLFELKCADMPDFEIVGKFTDPMEAIAYVRKHEVDFALLDIDMPGMNGIELAKQMRQLRSDIIIVFATAHSPLRGGGPEDESGLYHLQAL